MRLLDWESQILSYLRGKYGRPTELDRDSPLLDSGILDSMGFTELVGYLEASSKRQIPDDQLVPQNFSTVRTIMAMLERLLGDIE